MARSAGSIAYTTPGYGLPFTYATTGSVGTHTRYPLGGTLDEVYRVFWKFKKLRVAYQITYTPVTGSPFTQSDDVTDYLHWNGVDAPTSIRDGLTDYELTGQVGALRLWKSQPDNMRLSGGAYYPKLYFGQGLVTTDGTYSQSCAVTASVDLRDSNLIGLFASPFLPTKLNDPLGVYSSVTGWFSVVVAEEW